jgi:hypothetical protein
MKTNDQTYLDLIAWRDKLDSRQTELQAELEDVSRKLESVSTALALLDGTPPPLSHRVALAQANPAHTPVSVDVDSLRGLRQVDALTKIAQQGGGQFETTVAKKLLLQAGLISNPKNANNILFSVIQRSGKFEKVDRGVYRLIGEKPERPERPQLPLSNE